MIYFRISAQKVSSEATPKEHMCVVEWYLISRILTHISTPIFIDGGWDSSQFVSVIATVITTVKCGETIYLAHWSPGGHADATRLQLAVITVLEQWKTAALRIRCAADVVTIVTTAVKMTMPTVTGTPGGQRECWCLKKQQQRGSGIMDLFVTLLLVLQLLAVAR